MSRKIYSMFLGALMVTSALSSAEKGKGALSVVPSSDIVRVKDFLMNNIAAEAREKRSASAVEEIFMEIGDEKGEIIGAISGFLFYGSIMIDMLWVKKSARRQKIGEKLLQKIEDYGRERGAKFSTVTTMDWWNCLEFYKNNGYVEEFVREGYEHNSKQYSLIKIFCQE